MRKLATMLLTGALIASMSLPVSAQTQERNSCPSEIPRAGYTDVDPGSPHAFDIDCIRWRGITDRSGTFGPSENLPRWEMASWMTGTVAQVQWYRINNPITFTDIGALPADVQNDIEFIKLIGITKGTSETTYDPLGAVPRWQMALFLTRLVEATGNPLPDGTPYGFVDIAGQTAEAQLAINQLAQLGITFGTSATTFSPDQPVTREQMASFVARSLERIWAIFPMSSNCEGTAPAVCTGSNVEGSPSTAVPVRVVLAGYGAGLSPTEWALFLQRPGLQIDLYIDGILQQLTPTVAIRPGLAYVFWSTTLAAGVTGVVEFRTTISIDGNLAEETIFEIEFF